MKTPKPHKQRLVRDLSAYGIRPCSTTKWFPVGDLNFEVRWTGTRDPKSGKPRWETRARVNARRRRKAANRDARLQARRHAATVNLWVEAIITSLHEVQHSR